MKKTGLAHTIKILLKLKKTGKREIA